MDPRFPSKLVEQLTAQRNVSQDAIAQLQAQISMLVEDLDDANAKIAELETSNNGGQYDLGRPEPGDSSGKLGKSDS